MDLIQTIRVRDNWADTHHQFVSNTSSTIDRWWVVYNSKRHLSVPSDSHRKATSGKRPV